MANAQTVVITWTPNTEIDLAGYRISFGRSTNGVVTYVSTVVDITKAEAIAAGYTQTLTTTTTPGSTIFVSDGLWYISMQAYDTSNNFSARATPQTKRIIRTGNKLKVRR
jgi:hypothetical protein